MKRLSLITLVLTSIVSPSLVQASWEILDLPTDRGFGAIWAIDEQTIFVSGHHGLWKTFDGITWAIDSGYQSGMIYFVDDTLGFLSGKTLTTDGGKTWLKGDTVNGQGIQQVFFPPDQSSLGYGVPYIGDIRKTEDGGWHWEALPPFPDIFPTSDEEVYPSHICFPSDPDTGYLTAEIWQIISLDPFEAETYYSYFKTTDGGQSWALNEDGLWNDDFRPYLVDFPQNASVGYMAGYGKVFKTTNGGATWDTVLVDTSMSMNDMTFPETDQWGYVIGSNKAYRTLDGGQTWQYVDFGSDTSLARCHFINNRVGFITGVVPDKTLSMMPYDPGFVLKTTDGLLGIAEENWVDCEPRLIEISTPAVFSRELVLRYQAREPGEISASLYDASGSLIESLVPVYTAQGSGSLSFNPGLPSGVYFVRLEFASVQGNQTKTLKAVKVR